MTLEQERAAELLNGIFVKHLHVIDNELHNDLIAAVAAALAEKDKEMDEARSTFMKAVGDYQGSEFAAITELQAEAAALREQISELTTAYSVRNDEVTGLQGMLAEAKAEAAALRQYVAEFEGLPNELKGPDVIQAKKDLIEHMKQAARVEGLRRAKEIVFRAGGVVGLKGIDAEIAALERGKEK